MASWLTASFLRVLFQLPQFSRQRQSFSAHRAAPMTKTDLIFCIFFKVCRFRSTFSRHRSHRLESGLTVAWFSWTNRNSLLRKVTNEIASFCIDNRLRQMAFFVFVKVGKGRLSRYVKRLRNKKGFFVEQFVSLLYKTNRFYVAVRLFSNRSKKTSKCNKNISNTLGYGLVCYFQFLFLTTFLRLLWSITEQTRDNKESIC